MRHQHEIKFIFTGSVGSGKTSAIAAISEVSPVQTEVKTAEKFTDNDKHTTTVAMDYGYLTLDSGERLHLYGTPGQKRFDFMSSILAEGALGLILLINNTHPNPLAELEYYLKFQANFLQTHPAVIGVTHSDVKKYPAIEDYYDALEKHNSHWPAVRVDARKKEDVRMLLRLLAVSLEQS